MRRINKLIITIGILIGISAIAIPFVPFTTRDSVVSQGQQSSFAGVLYQSQVPVSDGDSFYGVFNVSGGPPNPDTYSSSEPSVQFYVMTPAQFESWQGSKYPQLGPSSFDYGAGTSPTFNNNGLSNNWIYYFRNQTLSFPYHLHSNLTTVYYFVLMYPNGINAQESYSVSMYVIGRGTAWWIQPYSIASGILGAVLIGLGFGVDKIKLRRRSK